MATPMINKRLVREFALTVAKQRHHKFTRVGKGFFDRCEANLKTFISGHVMRLPSKGKTIE
jgi:hypothetical protein